jgi:hypothetical protein
LDFQPLKIHLTWNPRMRVNDQTPLAFAAEKRHQAVVKLLPEKGAGLESNMLAHGIRSLGAKPPTTC